MVRAPNFDIQQPAGTPLEVALQMAEQGWAVFPLKGKRQPLAKRGVYAATTDPTEIRSMFSSSAGREATGVGGSCAGKVVVDVDPRNGGTFPEGLPPTRVHYSGRGDGGCHLVYSLPEGVGGLKSSTSDIAPGVDIKTGEGSYIVLPGSIHPDSGNRYSSNSVDIAPIPSDLLQLLRNPADKEQSRPQTLASLLANPPEVGGRNEWLTRVAGHYARQYRHDEDSYHQSLYTANRLLRSPMDTDEVAKTAASIWSAEMEALIDPDLEAELDESNGWIASGGDCMRTLAYEGYGKNRVSVAYELAMFDLQVQGRLWDPDSDSWMYECNLRTRRRPGHVERVLVSSDDLGNPRQARQFFARRALAVGSGAELVHRQYDWCSRILMYLDSQPAPERTLSRRLGWVVEEGGFVTNQGTIDGEGLRDSTAIVPDPHLDWVGDTYGFAGTADEAQQALIETLHFQEAETAVLFGSWWAATLAKQWIQPRVSQFPVCAVEAASGSGKTTGFFSFMTELAGSTTGEGHYTPAVLRNRLAANSNGLTWVDDLENPEAVHETIRVLTAGGSLSKMDGNMQPKQFELVGSLLISGETLGFESQRALRDRVLMLAPPPPQGRTSRHDSTRSQWLDVVDLREQLATWGGGHQIAGHYLQAVSRLAPSIPPWFAEERASRDGGGRLRDRDLVLLVGARVLDHLVDGEQIHGSSCHQIVSDWVARRDRMSPAERLEISGGGEAIDGDNTLTTKLIPAYLAEHGTVRMPGTAVAIDEQAKEIWVSFRRLSKWWSDQNHGRTNARTESADSLLAQLRQLRTFYPGQADQDRKRLDGGRKTNPKKVWVLSGDIYESIVARLEYN